MAEPHAAQKSLTPSSLRPRLLVVPLRGSKSQPFCDGTHKTTEFTPVKFTVTKPKNCGCAAASAPRNQPFCDGTHKTL